MTATVTATVTANVNVTVNPDETPDVAAWFARTTAASRKESGSRPAGST